MFKSALCSFLIFFLRSTSSGFPDLMLHVYRSKIRLNDLTLGIICTILHEQTLKDVQMFEDFTLTNYASAVRLTNGQLEKQSSLILQNKHLLTFVESISQMVLILNEHRQIVYANHSYKDFCKTLHFEPLTGKRPGETFSCKNAFHAAGCGTTKMCKNCGAVNAILESKKGIKSTKECKILTQQNDAIDLKVMASPLDLDGEKFTIFSVLDISNEKRRQSLERVFIHDILNSAGGISGLSAILKEIDDPNEVKEIAETIENAAVNLIEEIQAQREIGSAERGDLQPNFEEVDACDILKELKQLYTNHELNFGKPINVFPSASKCSLRTDRVLLKRVLGNMIKNAIEVNTPDDMITIKCEQVNGSACFSVHNKSVIPAEAQMELFKRFFSTKGNGRGLGTYGMKLFGEKYLKGKVWFESKEEKGTTFFIELPKK